MAIQFAERVEDAALIWNSAYGLKDRQAVEVLLACQVPCALPYPWLQIETNYYNPNYQFAWFNATDVEVVAMPILRVNRSRITNQKVFDLLGEEHAPKLMLEPNYEAPRRERGMMFGYLTQKCVRVRVTQPLTVTPSERDVLELQEAARRVLDPRWRQSEGKTLPKPPAGLLYYAEVLQRIAAYARDWEILLTNLRSLAARRAYLYDREVEDEDWELVKRVMRDMVPQWIARILESFRHQPYRRWAELRGILPDQPLRAEMRGLITHGILYSYKGAWWLNQKERLGDAVLELISGIPEL